MAYLDPKSVDREKDLFAVDEVFPTVANEVFQVYHSQNLRWFYVPDNRHRRWSSSTPSTRRRARVLLCPTARLTWGMQARESLGRASRSGPLCSTEIFFRRKEMERIWCANSRLGGGW